ncbi:uncharacterized protein PAC_00820 [Phialocephala subalpina]|uniref:Uncharacterized protein n=1 Tax=Phialocephala subalpina TaxID=576137 RepID=A0A1L7WDT1_9HELO|nr:uncharacterized protein PAC_00820 [Phialocephala subalpina]
MKFFLLIVLTAFSLTEVAAQSTCTSANAHPIDADVAFVAFWTILAVDWLAIAIIVKRSDTPSLDKRTQLTCSATEQCLSFKNSPFCYDRTAKTFHAADGTTGNFNTGAYTLPDGRQGNLYSGPYPTLTSGEITAVQTSTGLTMTTSSPLAVGTSTAVQSSGSVVSSPAGASVLASTSAGKAGSGTTSTAPGTVVTQTSVTVLKSAARSAEKYGGSWSLLLSGFTMTIIGLWM